MEHKRTVIVWLPAAAAVSFAWFPHLPWEAALFLLLPAALVYPGRAVLASAGHDASLGATLALSPLFLAATSWPVAGVLGGLATASRAALTLWVILGAAAGSRTRRGTDRRRESWPGVPAWTGIALALALAIVPLLANPSLWTRTGARLFLPMLGELQGGITPPTNPFLVGTPSAVPWIFAGILAPLRALTGIPAPLFLVLLQLTALAAVLLAAQRWLARSGGGAWAQLLLPFLLLGGMNALGFRGWSHLESVGGPAFPQAPLARAMVAFSGGGNAAGLLPAVWGVSPLPWALAFLAAAGSLSAGAAFRSRPLAVGTLLGAAILLQPAVGLVGTVAWAGGRFFVQAQRGATIRETVGTLLLAGLVAASALPAYAHPFVLPRPPEIPGSLADGGWRALVEALPLLALAVAAWKSAPGGAGWAASLLAGLAAAGSGFLAPGGIAAFAWVALLFAGIPAAARLGEWAPRGAGRVLLPAAMAFFLLTPLAMATQAVADSSGRTRWTRQEKAMLLRADASVPADAVLLYPTTTRETSEEQVFLCRSAYLGPQRAVRFFTGGKEDSVAVRRRRLVGLFERGHNPVAVLDSIAAETSPRPLFFLVSSEDASRHPGILESILPTVTRFRAVENSKTLKILAYTPPG